MSTLMTVARSAITGHIPFVGHLIADKVRFVSGMTINIIGASVLLAEAFSTTQGVLI